MNMYLVDLHHTCNGTCCQNLTLPALATDSTHALCMYRDLQVFSLSLSSRVDTMCMKGLKTWHVFSSALSCVSVWEVLPPPLSLGHDPGYAPAHQEGFLFLYFLVLFWRHAACFPLPFCCSLQPPYHADDD
eukprot:scpid108699/ scgid9426/ 